MSTDSERVTLTVDEAARMLGISRNSAFRAVQRGDLPAIRIGRRLLVSRERLLALLDLPDQTSNHSPDRTSNRQYLVDG
jgi:excisionase family DNA binding protein